MIIEAHRTTNTIGQLRADFLARFGLSSEPNPDGMPTDPSQLAPIGGERHEIRRHRRR